VTDLRIVITLSVNHEAESVLRPETAPGGVGPMTIAVLLEQTVKAAEAGAA
jgi:5,10-methylene-tetrahydrofolate dehydrogenase/methenyl tetrahydrofolate cyclohydrolase